MKGKTQKIIGKINIRLEIKPRVKKISGDSIIENRATGTNAWNKIIKNKTQARDFCIFPTHNNIPSAAYNLEEIANGKINKTANFCAGAEIAHEITYIIAIKKTAEIMNDIQINAIFIFFINLTF